MKSQYWVTDRCLLIPSFSLPCLLVLHEGHFAIGKIITNLAEDAFSGLDGPVSPEPFPDPCVSPAFRCQ